MSRIRADQLVNRAGSGGPKFPHGVAEGFSVSGIVTATSYRGDGSQLTGIDASSLKDGSNVKVQAVSGGANVTGNVAATGNVTAVDVTASGNVSAVDVTASGNVSAVNGTFSGNLTVQGTTTTIDTAVTSVDSLSLDGNITIGSTIHAPDFTDGGATKAITIGTIGDALLVTHSSGRGLGYFGYEYGGDRLVVACDGGSGTNKIDFITDAGTTSGADNLDGKVPKMRITAAGNVGIGVTDPSEKLEVNGGKIFIDGGGNRKITLDPGSNSTYDSRIDASHTLVFRSYVDAGAGVKTCTFNTNGHLIPGDDNGQDLGASNARWRNIYTGDLNLSNEGSANDVDGTWGQYTIQEGEDDLFLINRRTGKKYKFNLTEVN